MYKNVSDYLSYNEYWDMDIHQVMGIAISKQEKINKEILEKVKYDTSLAWYQEMLGMIADKSPKSFPKEPPKFEDDSEEKQNTNALSFGQSMKALIEAKKKREKS